MVSIAYSDGTPGVSFRYNRLGQQVKVTDGTGTREMAYNDFLQLAAETNAAAVLTRSFDSLGRPGGLALDSGYAVGYGYAGDGRFLSVSSSVASVFNYSYVPNSDLVAGHSNSVVQVSRGFEPNRDLVASVDNAAGAIPISGFTYQNDEHARRVRRVDNATVTNDFGYNPRSELTAAAMGTNIYGFVYDPIGNRMVATNNAEVLSYVANSLNQYTSITDTSTITPTFDADGNMLTCAGWSFSWDGENRLVGASNGASVATFAYDYMGRRYQKVAGSVTHTFIYDGWAMVQERTSTGATNSYVYGLDLSGSLQGAGTIGGILAADLGGTTVFYAFDANGNVVNLADASGSNVATYAYDAYGNTIAQSGAQASTNPFRFSTKYTDDETGLVYFGFRYYNSGLGRWQNRDPLGELGGDSLYGFLQNDPLNALDFLGLWSHQHDCTEEQLTKLRLAEAEAKRRMGLWKEFIDPGPDDLEIVAYLETRFRSRIRVGNWRLVNIFNRDLKNKTTAIKSALDSNAYGVECECNCNANTIAYVIRNWLALGWDDDIHFCPSYFTEAENEQVAYFVHEMSHYVLGTSDDYSWVQPSARLNDSLGIAQFYEDMGRFGRSQRLVEANYYNWLNASVVDAMP